jgi:hypothetical protein
LASTTKYVAGQDEPIIHDGPTEMAVDTVPRVDDTEPAASYQDWSKADTRVITCRIANDVYPGPRYDTRDAAFRAVQREHGRIYEANYVPGRAFFRVKK